jgi:general stress protein YciG
LSTVQRFAYNHRMQCPQCGYQLGETELLSQSAVILGRRGTGAAKSRDPTKMREAGRLGGRATAMNRRTRPTGAKSKRNENHGSAGSVFPGRRAALKTERVKAAAGVFAPGGRP